MEKEVIEVGRLISLDRRVTIPCYSYVQANRRLRIQALKTDLAVSLVTAPEFQSSLLLQDSTVLDFLSGLTVESEHSNSDCEERQRCSKRQRCDGSNNGCGITEGLVELKSSMATLLFLEKDCFKFYPRHCRGYLTQLRDRISLAISTSRESEDNYAVSDLLRHEVRSLQSALGYTGMASHTGVPQPFLDADPKVIASYSLDDDGFEIV